MIVTPQNQKEYLVLAGFLQNYAGVQFSNDLRLIGWVVDDQIHLVVGLNGFIGKVCQMHVAMAPGHEFSPRAMLDFVFKTAFITLDCWKVLGVVNSNNVKAMKYDLHLGFREVLRFPRMHDDGGDIVLLEMNADECKYIQMLDVPMEVA